MSRQYSTISSCKGSLTSSETPISCNAACTDAVESIAIVGMAIGFPQDIESPETLWKLMMEKRSTASGIPQGRMDPNAMYHPDPIRRGQVPVKRAHFMERDLAVFDAPFFATSTIDAACMDPQQRVLLEYTYLALENAGMPMERVSGSKTSVYTGSFSNDWQYLTYRDGEECAATSALGTACSLNANRISWFFNFSGASANIDTACSSSLVCLDLACQGLRLGNEKMSIVAGSNIMLAPDVIHSLTNMNMLSPDGECYSFDQRANGYSRSEGVGVLVLKRVADAIHDGDTIRGIIRNSGCNQDGRTTSVAVPSAESQAELIRKCYNQANLSMDPVRFIEAHGTGTVVGDPTEATGFGSIFRNVRTQEDPLWVGAIKANIGHLEGASGIAGVIKALLVLEKAIIPPNRLEKLNSQIDADFLRLRFPTEATAWPTKGLRRASVNSFGNGGTNAHVILDDVFHFLLERNLIGNHITVCDPPSRVIPHVGEEQVQHDIVLPPQMDIDQDAVPQLLVLSAADEAGVKRQAKRYASHFSALVAHPEDLRQASLADVAYTLSDRRSKLAWRSFAVVDSIGDLTRLDQILSRAYKPVLPPGVGFVFTGQGAQWAGMGSELLSFPLFRATLLRLEEHLGTFGCPWMLRTELLRKDDSRIHLPQFAQPLCTAIQIALIDLLRDYHIVPSCVVGHSSGEIAAAYCIGALSDYSAMKVAYYRGQMVSKLAETQPVKTSMMSVGMSETEIKPYLAREATSTHGRPYSVSVACVNSPSNITLSGEEDQLNDLEIALIARKTFCRKLAVNVAYHSPHMRTIAESYRQYISPLCPGNGPDRSIRMISSVSVGQAVFDELSDPEYWVQNLTSPVQFASAVSTLCSRRAPRAAKKLDLSHNTLVSVDLLVEIGPHSTLQRPIRENIESLSGTIDVDYAPCLLRDTDAIDTLFAIVGRLYCMGYNISLERVNSTKDNRKHGFSLTNLPGYAFDHSKTYWNESRISAQYRLNTQGRLDLLGKPVADWNPLEPRWRNHLRVPEMPWIEHHTINGSLVYPGAGMLVMAIEAMHQMVDRSRPVEGIELGRVSFVKPIPIDLSVDGIETQISLRMRAPDQETRAPWCEFRIFAFEKPSWHERCRGFVRAKYQEGENEVDQETARCQHLRELLSKANAFEDSCTTPLLPEIFYGALKNNNGVALGPPFQRVLRGNYDDQGCTTAELELYQWPKDEYPQDHVVHPTIIDALFQVAMAAYAQGGHRATDTMIPTYLEYLFVSLDGMMSHTRETVHEFAWLENETHRATTYGGFVLNENKSTVLAEFNDVRLTRIARSKALDAADYSEDDQLAFELIYAADIDNLKPEETMSLCSSSSESALYCWIDLLSHKNPRLEILNIGSDGLQLNCSLLRHLSTLNDEGKVIMTRYHTYHFMSASLALLEEEKERLKLYPGISFTQVDMTCACATSDLIDAFDLIIAPELLSHQDGAMRNIRDMLKSNGKLALSSFTAEYASEQDTHANKPSLAAYGLSDSRISLTWDSQQFVVYVLDSINLETSMRPVMMVCDASSAMQQEFCDRLSASLQARGVLTTKIGLNEAGQTAVADRMYVVVLELETPLLYNLSEEDFTSLKKLLITAKDIVWVNYQGGSVASRPEYAMVYGLSRVLQREQQNLTFTVASLDVQEVPSTEQMSKVLSIIDGHSHTRVNLETEFLENDGLLTIPRIRPSSSINKDILTRSRDRVRKKDSMNSAPPLNLSINAVGILSDLHFTEDQTAQAPLAAEDIEIHTKAIGLTYADCLVVLGQGSSTVLGQECAGVVTRAGNRSGFSIGDRIVLLAGSTFKTFARGNKSQALRIPDSISYTTAAAIPVNFTTAWEVVHRLARLQQGESILIHAAAGGTGQALTQAARLIDAEIFATVGNESKKRLLIDIYNISADHIFYSRDTGFIQQVKGATNGRGVDVVINSLQGDLAFASWECIASYGRIVEVGQRDGSQVLAMPNSVANVSFLRFDRARFQADKPTTALECLRFVFDRLIEGTFQAASPLNIFDISDVNQAFRVLAEGKSAGKCVVQLRDASQVELVLENRPTFKLKPDATYVIAGGLGGLGRAAARWMSGRGARNLLLLSRSGPKSQQAIDFIAELEARNVQVRTPICDVSDFSQVRWVLGNELKDMPTVKGCMQATMVRRDVLFADMTFETWDAPVKCKTVGTWNLHTLLPSGMDFFILLASGSGLSGIRGQTNYNVGNCYEDAFARYRVGVLRERATAFDLAVMRDDGLLAENTELMKRALGYGALKPVSRAVFHALLDRYCDPETTSDLNSCQPHLRERASQVAVGLGLGNGDSLESIDYERNPMMYPLQVLKERSGSGQTAHPGGAAMDPQKLFAASDSFDRGADIIAEAIGTKLRMSLTGIDATGDAVDLHHPLQAYGVDSLLAVELRNWLAKTFVADVAVFETQGAATIATLSLLVARRSKIAHMGWVSISTE